MPNAPTTGTVRVEVLRETPRGPMRSEPSVPALRDLLSHVERGLVTDPKGRPMHARVIVWLSAQTPADPAGAPSEPEATDAPPSLFDR